MNTYPTMNLNTCWMCGAEANSSEHRLKKADLVRAYGRGPYSGPDRPLHFRGNQRTAIQGPNSRTVKYGALICHSCNTTTSQPYDNAYDRSIEWLFCNEATVLRRRFINFADVFGPDFALWQLNLYKYFAKSFGCRLVDANQVVPNDVRALFGKEQFQTGLRITFSVNEDILVMPPDYRDGFVGKSDLVAMVERTDPSRINGFYFSEHVSWFTTHYWYGLDPDGDMGSIWIANCQHVHLGSHEPLSPDQRAEFVGKLAARGAGCAT